MANQTDEILQRLREAFIFDYESEAKQEDLSFIKGICFSYENHKLSVRFIIVPEKHVDAFETCSELATLFISRVTGDDSLVYEESTVLNPLSTPMENFNLGQWIARK